MEFISPLLHQACLGLFVFLLLLAGWTDLKTFTIPNHIPFALLVLVLPFGMTSQSTFLWWTSFAIGAAVLVVGLGFFSMKLMGGGDVKLMAVVALWAGPAHALDFILVTTLAGGFLSGFALLKRKFGFAGGWDNQPSQNVVPYGLAIAFGGLGLAALLIQGKPI
jgi:prepilin peptidase CpaA